MSGGDEKKRPTPSLGIRIPTADEVQDYISAPLPLLDRPHPIADNDQNHVDSAVVVVAPPPLAPANTSPKVMPPPQIPFGQMGAPPAKRRSSGGPTGRTPIVVSPRQRGNPLLRYIKAVPWEYADGTAGERMRADYHLTPVACALFLSVRYHLLHSDYAKARMVSLRDSAVFTLRVLLLLVDVDDSSQAVRDVSVLCASEGFTLVVAWSNEEAARYLETYKAYEHKSADSIREQAPSDADVAARIADALLTIRSVNKSDAAALMKHFGTLHAIVNASAEELALCPGMGPQKVRRVYDAFHKPFIPVSQLQQQQPLQATLDFAP